MHWKSHINDTSQYTVLFLILQPISQFIICLKKKKEKKRRCDTDRTCAKAIGGEILCRHKEVPSRSIHKYINPSKMLKRRFHHPLCILLLPYVPLKPNRLNQNKIHINYPFTLAKTKHSESGRNLQDQKVLPC